MADTSLRTHSAFTKLAGMSFQSAQAAAPLGGAIYRSHASNDAFNSPRESQRSRSERSGASFNSARSVDRSFRDAGSFATAPSQQVGFLVHSFWK